MPFSIVPFLLLGIPLLEIAVFVVIGGQIGVLPTLGLVLATAVAGSILLRIQGFGVLSRVQKTLNEGRVPGRELVHGVMILIAGILLLTPGFVTDTLGFLLFIPAVRDLGWVFLRDRIVVVGAGAPPGGRQERRQPRDKVIDLDMDDYSSSEPGKSPWREPDRPQD
ncbi:FxsA family protein [Chelativorans salis]|uniref:Membrane protein FxsA n=1 Tax=Chelativorans salis TaxID=2978478 RepID=A0ABT2LSS9_9HYPH|nr:FxsA family protein [Chelativorans sp. EGI FJ00035]MCT7376234.1 membrane protein FxsA [Chelativorans sp. EGI FJ00035]